MSKLSVIEEYYQHRDRRARELRKRGKKVVGYLCCYAPAELITAANLVPYRITGNVWEPITQADAHLETIACPFIRSCFDIALQGHYDFLDGFVVPHTCDNVAIIYNIWKQVIKPACSHFINIPHVVRQDSLEFFEKELGMFRKWLQELTGQHIDTKSLNNAIQEHNENRALIRELYSLTKQDPPLLSGVEMGKTLLVAMSLPVDESKELLQGTVREVKQRRDGPEKKPARVLICGSESDDIAFVQLVEESNANVVIDDLCIGTKMYWHDVEVSDSPMASLAKCYLDKLTCPRTYREKIGTHEQDLVNRFGHIPNLASDWRVSGIILRVLRNCDTHGFDAPDLRTYLQQAGFPVLYIEDEYFVGSMARLKTRIQAFIEMIS